jgi:carbon-monoxide dehydrogenase large subunit
LNICTGSYDIPTAYLAVDGVYTNKAPGGVAYRCSFRVTEAAYFIERMVEVLAIKLGMDAAELRMKNFISRAVPVSVRARLGVRQRRLSHRLEKALDAVDYTALRKEQASGSRRSSAARRAS